MASQSARSKACHYISVFIKTHNTILPSKLNLFIVKATIRLSQRIILNVLSEVKGKPFNIMYIVGNNKYYHDGQTDSTS